MTKQIREIGVIGAGRMGGGIAQVFATNGYPVHLYDIDPDRIDAARGHIEEYLDRQLESDRLSREAHDNAIDRISPANSLNDLGGCDLVIEAAAENIAIKKRILSDVSQHLKPDAIIATNTSSISITALAESTDRPQAFLGVHFMNPAPVMRLVEIIRGVATSRETFETTKALIEDLGKTIAVSEDFPAFIVNRLLMPMINEAIFSLYEGVGTVEAIDQAMKLGANHPMGPLELADYIGLDICLAIMQVLYEGLSDTKYRPCPLLEKYVEAGWLGRKTQRGFYDYSTQPPTPTR